MDAKKKTLLAILLGLMWVVLAVWQWSGYHEPVHVPLTNVSGLGFSGASVREKATGLRVNLGLLASARTQREATFTTPRNIFAVPRPDGTISVGNESPPVAEAQPIPAQTLTEQAAAAELAQYRYLGFLRMGESRKKNKDVAVLSKNEEVVVVKVGEYVQDHLVLKIITPDSVTIRDTVAHLEQTLSLSEEPPVQP